MTLEETKSREILERRKDGYDSMMIGLVSMRNGKRMAIERSTAGAYTPQTGRVITS